jgi:chromosome segregation ATPase
MSHLDAAASRLQSATEELRTKETILQRASASLNKLLLSDPPASEETLAKAKLGVAEAKLGVAEAKLGVAEANEALPGDIAGLKGEVAKAEWGVASAKEALAKAKNEDQGVLRSLQSDINAWRAAYEKTLSGQLSAPH